MEKKRELSRRGELRIAETISKRKDDQD